MAILTKASFNKEISTREIENSKVAYKAGVEGIVLLHNDNVLPLKTKKVALYGAGIRKTVKGGTGSGEVNERHSVTIYEAFENQNYEITTKKWLDDYDNDYQKGL